MRDQFPSEKKQEELGRKLRALRKGVKKTLKTISAEANCSIPSLGALERGEVMHPCLFLTHRLSVIYGVSIDFLLGLEVREVTDGEALEKLQEDRRKTVHPRTQPWRKRSRLREWFTEQTGW